jgi:uncharacterized protein (DUF1684 family)
MTLAGSRRDAHRAIGKNVVFPAVLAVLSGCTPELPQMEPEVHRAEIEAWQTRRTEGLKAPDGWLSVVGLYWLEPGENTFGSSPLNNIHFPTQPGVPDRIGAFVLEDEMVRMEVEEGVPVTMNGEEVQSAVLLPQGGGPTPRASLGSLSWQALQRQDLIGIRLRDSESPAIDEFQGIEMFPVDLAWRIHATFHRYDPPETIQVPNVLGQISEQPSPGAVVFRVDGKRLRLDVTGDPEGESFSVVFGDETNGLESYGGGRFLTVPAPDAQGRLFIDFNRAYNPPCVFTDFATCPLPPPQNKLEVRIEAGEKSSH